MSKQLLSYRESCRKTIDQIMSEDDSVFLYGCDVGDHTATYGSSSGLKDKFGEMRVLSTPISEEGNLGIGIGAAINGLRPINIHIRTDFLLLAMNQLINMAANINYLSNGTLTVPLTIRAIIGRGWGQGAQHSKSLQSIFAHIPGLKVYMPFDPQSIRDTLKQSIHENQPSIILEHRWLFDIEDEVEIKQESFLSEKTVSKGSDLTIIATSWMVVEALFAQKILRNYDLHVEVIAIVDITDFNLEVITKSVQKTKNILIADYDWSYCGFASEVAQQVYSKCFQILERPIKNIGFEHQHCPTARKLENKFYPSAKDILHWVKDQYSLDDLSLDTIEYLSYENKFKGPF